MQQIDIRAAYHETRRRLTLVRQSGTIWQRWDMSQEARDRCEKRAREGVLGLLGLEVMPRGLGGVPAQMAEAVREVRRMRAYQAPSLAQRAKEWRRRRYLAEASRRGLPTTLYLAKNPAQDLRVVSEGKTAEGYHVALLRADGWAKYSSRVPCSKASLAILAGQDDAGLWAVRVPGTMTTVGAALDWLEPAEVRRGREEGRRVLRQGDVYVVERARDGMADSLLPSGHVWEAATRTLVHDGHARLHVPFPARAFRQSTLAAHGSARQRGD